MKKLVLFLAILVNCSAFLHSTVAIPESDNKKIIAVVGSDITALWSAYFLIQEIETRGLIRDWEIHLIGEDLSTGSELPLFMPMMMSGNIPEMLKEQRTRREIQEVLSLQSRNQKLTREFLLHFDETEWLPKRMGSYLAVEKEDTFNQDFYGEQFFNFKLPLSHYSKDELPFKLKRFFSKNWELYHVPFDSIIDETHLRNLLLSYLLEERADRQQVTLHLSSCRNFTLGGDHLILELENGEIVYPSACIFDLEKETIPLINTLSPDSAQEVVLEAVLTAKGFGFSPPHPYFVQFPSEEIILSFGKDQKVYFYRKLVGMCHDELKQKLLLHAQTLYPYIDDFHFQLSTLYRPLDRSSPILRPFGKESPVVIINQDQSERISQGASMGELSCKAIFDSSAFLD